MFIYTAKFPRKRVLLALALLVIAGGITAAFFLSNGDQDTQSVSAALQPVSLRNNEDRVSYLESLGWAVTPETAAIEELEVPKTFDSTLDSYLALQSSQGFNMNDLAGKTVKRYTYAITNYPGGDADMMISVLVYKKNLVGGEVFNSATGEILHGLAMPGSGTTATPPPAQTPTPGQQTPAPAQTPAPGQQTPAPAQQTPAPAA